MSHVSRRSVLASSAAAAATASSLLNSVQAVEDIPGFDQTRTDFDRTKSWQPFSDRKVRVGIVGHGVCQFSLAFDLQHHPNVELVAVSDLFPDRYERSSTLITSNLPFSEWQQIFQRERMTAALLDRHTHHCEIFEMTGESFRFRESMKSKQGLPKSSDKKAADKKK
jgi:hypothetical protein